MEEWQTERLDAEEWDEEDWESFLRQVDVRLAKYQELFETLRDHPSRDLLIAREMGWDSVLGECTSEDQECLRCPKQADCEIAQVSKLWAATIDASEGQDSPDEFEHDLEGLERIDAYRTGCGFSLEVDMCFKELFVTEGQPDEDVLRAVSLSGMVPAKIAGGHGMGYEREGIGGNIAYCKRALKCLGQCVETLQGLGDRELVPVEHVSVLVGKAAEVEQAVQAWIGELRSRTC